MSKLTRRTGEVATTFRLLPKSVELRGRARPFVAVVAAFAALLGGCDTTVEPNAELVASTANAVYTITTDKSSYVSTDPVVVSFAGGPGNALDWVSLSVPGSATSSYVVYGYLGGSTSGTYTFSGAPAGTYVARLHPQGSYTTLVESASFTMSAAASTATTDASSYAAGTPVNVTFTGATSNSNDWVGISAPGSPTTSYVTWAYTGGGKSGGKAFANVPAGTWVARLHPYASYAVLSESASFTVAVGQTTTTPTSLAFASGSAVTVDFTGLPGNTNDWIGISAPGSSTSSYVGWVYTNGGNSGRVSISGIANGSYVARSHPSGSYMTLAESATFTLGAGGSGAAGAAGSAGSAGAAGASTGGPTSWADLSSGGMHTCGIGADGSLWCWGDNSYGQLGDGTTTNQLSPTRLGTGTTWSKIGAGGFHTCATKTDGTLWCWGYNAVGMLGDGSTNDRLTPTQIGTGTTWNRPTGGSYHTCATKTDGTLSCWGYNSGGQVGDGTTAYKLSPVQVGVATTWSNLAAGWMHTCGTMTDGTLWCWGANATSQIGDGTTVDKSAPVQIAGTTWATPGAGHDHTCARKTDNSVWCWGANANGQVGDATTVTKTTPTQIEPTTSWSSIAVGEYHTCGKVADGSVACWGYNASGQLGDGTTVDKTVPTTSTILSTSILALGMGHTCEIQAAGGLYCWGDNTSGAVGDGTTVNKTTPVHTGTAAPTPGWAKFMAQGRNGAGIGTDGSLWIWGGDSYYQIGDAQTTDKLLPKRVGTANDWGRLATHSNRAWHTCAQKVNGSLWCWGSGSTGEIGNNSTVPQQTPIQIGTATDWTMISTGYPHTCGIKRNGQLWCWGENVYGCMGDGTTTIRKVPAQTGTASNWVTVSNGSYVVCGIQSDGTLWCWGDNAKGELGNGTTTGGVKVPTRVGTFSDWVSVDASIDFVCGIRSNNTLWCWGGNVDGEIGDGTTVTRSVPTQVAGSWSKIGTSQTTPCGIKTDGSLWCWGYNTNGRIGDGTTVGKTVPTRVGVATTWTDVIPGGQFNCAAQGTAIYCWGYNANGQMGNNTTVDRLSPALIPAYTGT